MKDTLKPLVGAVVRPIQIFFRLETASAIVLLTCAAAALTLANTSFQPAFQEILTTPLRIAVGHHAASTTFTHLINDGLMTVFFFVVGMEIKRELAVGELSTFSKAVLPAIAALGGMIFPAGIYLLLNRGTPGEAGWGIPMATDIAFSIGALTLLRRRVPHALLVFLTALAIFDDIGGIIVIAVFYGHGINGGALLAAAAITGLLIALGRFGVRSGLAYAAAGAALWYALHEAGIHPTIAGVVTGLAVPARAPRGDLEAPLDRLVHLLHPFVAFGVMPLFALANSGVRVVDLTLDELLGPTSAGVFLGLVVGKTAGVFAATMVAVRSGFATSPGGAGPSKLLGVGAVSGIGFTVALFIANLAFPAGPELLGQAKLGILLGSFAAGAIGCVILRMTAVVRD